MKTFDEERERQEQLGNEWKYGVITTDLASIPVNLRESYLPLGVLQFNNVMDTSGCASRGPLNCLEAKLQYFYDNGMHPNLQKWFDNNGYRKNGKFALCDAFIEILSGTTRQGNSLKAPIVAISEHGVIPAYLIPLEDNMTWEQYMNPTRITKAHTDLGKEFLRRIWFNYEQVPLAQFREAIRDDILDVALPAWPAPIDGVYPRMDGIFNHAVIRFDNEINIFDNYIPFVKKLALDYRFFDWAYSFSITGQNPFPDETLTIFEVLQKYGLLRFFSVIIERLFSDVTKLPPPPPPKPPEISVLPPEQPKVPPPPPEPQPVPVLSPSEHFYNVCKESLGQTLVEKDKAELGCVNAISFLRKKAFGNAEPQFEGTWTFMRELESNGNYKEISTPEIGAIILCATGTGNGKLPHGHTGTCGKFGIMSNDSDTGKWMQNYSYEAWKNHFEVVGGFKTRYFIRIKN